MSILLFTTSPPTKAGGVESVYKSLADSLRVTGALVHEMYLNNSLRGVRRSGNVWQVPLEYPRTWYKLPRPTSAAKCVASALLLARTLYRMQPDVVNIHYIDAHALYFALLKPFFGYRLVVSAHGTDLLAPAHVPDRLALPFILRTADLITTVSEVLAKRVAKIAPSASSNVNVIPNGIDTDFWTPNNSRLPNEEPPIVIHVGRLEQEKGQDVLIRAMPAILAEEPECKLVLVGDGSTRITLQTLAADLEATDAVTFAGTQPPEQVRCLLRKATVFAFPSRSEGLGLALLEAMATGLPVVASNTGGIPEIVIDETGYLVHPADAAALSEAVLDLLQNPGRRSRLAVQARRRAEAFRWDQTAVQYESVLNIADETRS